ncbi:MAG: TonB-dependent receptor plug domain-containing protein, partial [Oceanibaculum sp.]
GTALWTPRAPLSSFVLTVDGDKEVTTLPAGGIERSLIGGKTVAKVALPVSDEVVFNWTAALPESAEQELRDAPATISVVSGDDLRERPVHDMAEALRGVPGITISSIGLGRRGISIRGMPVEHTLMLIDGRRINSAASAIAHADYDLNWVPVEAIERIEVVRGPMSSLYGSDALGGVVNIITRRATDRWKGSVSVKGGVQQG